MIMVRRHNVFCQCHSDNIYMKYIYRFVNLQVHLQCGVPGELWYLVNKGDNFGTKAMGQIV